MKLAAIYSRVSTTVQKDNGTSLATQEESGLAKAAEVDCTAPEEYMISEDWSGTDLERPGLLRLFCLAEAGLIDVVIILNSDRLYRPEYEGDEWRIFPILQRFIDAGVEVIWTDPAMPSQGPMASFGTFMGSWKAGEERRTLLRRTRSGRLATARNGGLLGGFIPFGYTYIPRTTTSLATLAINEVQAKIIREIFRWLIEEKLSCRAIAIRLTERAILTSQGNKVWQPSVVNHMVKQELYCGVMYFNRREPVRPQQKLKRIRTGKNPKSSRKLRPEEEWIPIPVPSIVDRATWERAQEQLESNARFSPRNNSVHVYLLRGIIQCGICGKSYSGVTNRSRGREYQYYVCNQRNPISGEEKCPSRHVPLLMLEKTVWEVITGLVQDPQKLELEYQSRIATTDQAISEPERKRLESELRRLEKAADRFLDLYGDEVFDREQLDNKLYENSRQKKAIAEQIQALDRRDQEYADSNRRWEDLHAFCDAVKASLGDLVDDERQRLLRLLIDRVTIKDKSIRIELAVPLEDPQAVYRLRPTRPTPSPNTQVLLASGIIVIGVDDWVTKLANVA